MRAVLAFLAFTLPGLAAAQEPALVSTSASSPALVSTSAAQPAAPAPPPAALTVCATASEGGAAIPGATIVAVGARGGVASATAGSDGCARFASLSPGTWRVTVTAPGTQPKDVKVKVPATGGAKIAVALPIATAGGEEVVIEARREAAGETRHTIQPEEAASVPGTQGDALKAVQDLPGLARTPFGLGGLLVRGSAPEDTQVFIDGQPIPQLYHFGGLTSVVATDFLSAIDFLPGGFGVRYGRAMGGVVDVSTKPGRDDRWGGLLDANIWDSELEAQGPAGADAKGGRVIVAARRSYIDVVLNAVVPADALTLTVAPRYYDAQARYDAPVRSDGSQLHLLAYGSDDEFSFLVKNPPGDDPNSRGRFFYRTTFERLQAVWTHPMANGWILQATPEVGDQNITIDAGTLLAITATQTSTAMRVEAHGSIAPTAKLLVGTELGGQQFSYRLRFPQDTSGNGPPTGTVRVANDSYLVGTGALYAEGELALAPGLTLVPGLRMDAYQPAAHISVDPRVALRWEPQPGRYLKSYLGLFQQPPDYQNWDRNLGNPHLRIQTAVQTGVGGGIPLAASTSVEGELFYKYLSDLVVQKASDPGQPNALAAYDNRGQGRAYGLELLLKRQLGERLSGWLAYTLSRAERADPYTPGGWHLFNYDQTHILTLVVGWKMPRDWEIGARYRFTSGNPTTPVAGSVYDSDSGSYVAIPGGLSSDRLPPFHQLDVRIDKHRHYRHWTFSYYLDVQNVYDHRNPEDVRYSFDYRQKSYLTGLPIIPSLGIKGEL